jgi:N-acetylmuramoyl-L-alanine amidase
MSSLRLVVLAAVAFLAAAAVSRAADVSDVRTGVHSNQTRLVIELNAQVPYKIFTLANPYRVVIDFPELDWRIPTPKAARKNGLISNFRYGLFKNANSRLVVDVRAPVAIVGHRFIPPKGRYKHRFVVDLKKVSDAAFQRSERQVASKNWVEPGVSPADVAGRDGKRTAPLRKGENGRGKRIVMIDPGHGGPDPGTVSSAGVYEKSVTLRTAKIVRRILEKTGRYTVVLTRNKDIYVPLRDRYKRAEDSNAELFISLHADSHRNRRLRGFSVYTLSERASDKEAAALAAHENRADAIAGIDLSRQSDAVASFLIELRQRQTMNESAIFSELLISELSRKVRMLRNTHRFAGFAVLKSPDIPSILLELGYLSNAQDARMLHRRAYLEKAAAAILKAADRYFERKERLSRS